MTTNYVLIDHENVQPGSGSLLDKTGVKVLVFVGASQKKIAVTLAATLQPLGTRVTYVQISSNGKNALDFHIAYYIGRLAVEDADAVFHVVSKDTGFDPLMQHLKTQKIRASVSASVEGLPFLKPASARNPKPSPPLPEMTHFERVELVAKNLLQRETGRPATRKRLTNAVKALLQNRVDDAETMQVISDLERQKVVVINGEKVTYAAAKKLV